MQKVLRASSDYEMTFNAKMTLARLGEGSQKDNKKTLAQLLKMVKDDKNKEYLDQIYFTLVKFICMIKIQVQPFLCLVFQQRTV